MNKNIRTVVQSLLLQNIDEQNKLRTEMDNESITRSTGYRRLNELKIVEKYLRTILKDLGR